LDKDASIFGRGVKLSGRTVALPGKGKNGEK
jgi:hypothetical protein